MGADGDSGQTYDLRRIEDVFACLEIISIARGALFGVDPQLAGKMEKVTDALGAFSQLVLEGDFEQASQEEVHQPQIIPPPTAPQQDALPVEEREDKGFLDLTINRKGGSKAAPVAKSSAQSSKDISGDDGIVDILTGERIK